MNVRLFHRHSSATRFVQLDTMKCQACWKCVERCHKQVIGKIDLLGHRHARLVHPQNCTGCLKCVHICQHEAFSSKQQHIDRREHHGTK